MTLQLNYVSNQADHIYYNAQGIEKIQVNGIYIQLIRGNLKKNNCQETFTYVSLTAARAKQGDPEALVHNTSPREMATSSLCA